MASTTFSENLENPFGPKDRKGFLIPLQNQTYDLCIIGGGITGAAIARDASLRGLSVLLLEKNDFAWGTSSRSSKLVHGGVRYLENFEFKLVFESTRERALLWQNAPDLCKPIPFLFPAFKDSRLSLLMLSVGLWLYDTLSLFRSPSLHKRFSKDDCRKKEPALKQKDLKGAIFYWDGATDDALLTLSNILDAQNHGAMCLSRTEVSSIEWASAADTSLGNAAHSIHINDVQSGEAYLAKARCVIGATGPWTDELHAKIKVFNDHKRMAPTRGSHFVVEKQKLPVNHAIVMTHPTDGRVLFAIPWDTHTVVGTTDIFDSESPDKVAMTPQEVSYLIDSCAYFFPDHLIKKEDIISTWTGLRPLLAPPKNASASDVSREHEIKWDERGYLYITGGKLTTHREMGKEAVDRVLQKSMDWEKPLSEALPRCKTAHQPFPRIPQIIDGSLHEFSQGIMREEELLLIQTMIRSQMILNLEDFLVRRTEIFYKHANNGVHLIPQLKELFCEELNLSEREWNAQVDDYEAYLAHHVSAPLGREAPRIIR